MARREITVVRLAAALAVCGIGCAGAASAHPPPANPRAANAQAANSPATFSPKQIEYFETKVRPILAGTCQKCHGADKQKGGLRLDSREAVLKGGESGPAVIPGDASAGPMIDAVNYRGLEMPPAGRLKDREIAALTEWIKMGAPWPKEAPTASTARPGAFSITDEDRRYWAFQPIGRPVPPEVHSRGWVANPIDAFVLGRLEQRGLGPNPPAEPRALIRRVFFDLIGLPPTPEEVHAFESDHSPAAYERLVDGLLSRKQYGECWGRHWLDVTRFAQTNGYERDAEKPESWRYRDYVIGAFNSDKPFNRFILEQLAGDELDDATNASIIATGFYRLGVWDDEPDDKRTAAWDEIDEMVRTTGAAFLGLTFGCARCHNHMFDPIPQEDYYSLAAFFRNVEPYGTPRGPNHLGENVDGIFTPLASPQELAAWRRRQSVQLQQASAAQAQIAAIRGKAHHRLVARRKGSAAPTDAEIDGELTPAERDARKRLHDEVAKLDKEAHQLPFPRALSVRECGLPLRETHLLIRGNAATPGKPVEPRLPTIFGGSRPHAQRPAAASIAGNESLRHALEGSGVKPTLGLRRALAEWVADEHNPLTPRVMMNRVWQGHFGRGIVRSTDNFGRAGTPPTHPELLAWLGRDFVDGGWHLKRMHKRIVMSRAYRMSSDAANAKAQAIDAENDLFWRQNLRRLDAEAIRDSILAVSGRLNLAMGGRGIFPPLSREVLATQSKPGFGWGKSEPADECRRSVYIYLKRTLMVPFLETFDYTNTAESLGTRPVTTVAPQSLLLLNSQFTREQAEALADRLRREAGPDGARQIDRLFRLALGRAPSADETRIAARMLARSSDRSVPAINASATGASAPAAAKKADDPLQELCLVMFNLNEFIYAD